MSAPRSNRYEASVDNAKRLPVWRTELGVKVGTLQRDHARAARHLGVGAAHDTGHGLRPSRVRDDQHVRLESPLLSVQRANLFTGLRTSDPQLVAVQAVEVECMHRMSALEHDVVGRVDHVVDRPDPSRIETRRQPAR